MSVSALASGPAPREPTIPAPLRFSFACPVCRGPLAAIAPEARCCPIDHVSYRRVDGIWRFLPPERGAYFAPFLPDYTTIRNTEGHGSDDPAHYHTLPAVAPHDPLA